MHAFWIMDHHSRLMFQSQTSYISFCTFILIEHSLYFIQFAHCVCVIGLPACWALTLSIWSYHELVREMFNKKFQYLIDNISVCFNIVFLTQTNSTIIFFLTLWTELSYIKKDHNRLRMPFFLEIWANPKFPKKCVCKSKNFFNKQNKSFEKKLVKIREKFVSFRTEIW